MDSTSSAAQQPSAEVSRKTNCPTCGAKLPDVPVSLCPYCASPLETASDREAQRSVHAARIGRVREHATFDAAMAFEPSNSADWWNARRRAWWGSRGLGVGLSLVGIGAWLNRADGASLLLNPWSLLGAALAGFGLFQWSKGKQGMSSALEHKLLKRPAIVLDRRSETAIHGWSGQTDYYFLLEFEDGVQGEFRRPGRGAQEDPYATNLPGVAYTRGTELLHFQHVRV